MHSFKLTQHHISFSTQIDAVKDLLLQTAKYAALSAAEEQLLEALEEASGSYFAYCGVQEVALFWNVNLIGEQQGLVVCVCVLGLN